MLMRRSSRCAGEIAAAAVADADDADELLLAVASCVRCRFGELVEDDKEEDDASEAELLLVELSAAGTSVIASLADDDEPAALDAADEDDDGLLIGSKRLSGCEARVAQRGSFSE